MAIVMLSTEVDERLELMDRVLVFRDGRPAAELPRRDLRRSGIVGEFCGQGGARDINAKAIKKVTPRRFPERTVGSPSNSNPT